MLLLQITGVPALPDLTQPSQLLQFGEQLLKTIPGLLLLLVASGAVLAIINFSYRQNRAVWLDHELDRYGHLWQGVKHGLLVLAILILGFLLCSTLANRYHHWEQDTIAQLASSVEGDRLEQPAPTFRYTVSEPYTSLTYVNGKPTEVAKQRPVDRWLALDASQIDVKIEQVKDPTTNRLIYESDFRGTYQVKNSLDQSERFVFTAPPPIGYSLLQDYRVEQNKQRLQPETPGDYNFSTQIAPGETRTFQVTYRAIGGPRWVYDAGGRSLSRFQLRILAEFANAAYASGIIPTETQVSGGETRFIWKFADNVSVKHPFGVFTASQPIQNTGILPRLLLLAPGIALWWLLLLYLTLTLRLRDVAIAAGVFFACLLCLTYASRIMDARLIWGLLSLFLLLLGWKLGQYHRHRWAGMVVTLTGAVLPVFGFLVPYTGLTLGIAGLLSVSWLLVGYFGEIKN